MNLYEKLINIRVELQKTDIPKSGQNKFSNFKYFELEDIIPPITNLCKEHKVFTCVSFNHNEATLKAINIEKADEMIEISSPMPELTKQDRMNIIQSVGSFETYQRRYLYMAMFDIIEKDTVDPVNRNNGGNKPKLPRPNGFKTIKKTNGFTDDPKARQYLMDITRELKEKNQKVNKANIMKIANHHIDDPDTDVDKALVRGLVKHLHNNGVN